jgi:ankyrin repeat protein
MEDMEGNQGVEEYHSDHFYDDNDSNEYSNTILDLQGLILEKDSEIRELRARVARQADMLDMLQRTLCSSAAAASEAVAWCDADPHPLNLAASTGNVAVIQELVAGGAASICTHGGNALLIACQKGHVEAAEALLALGADVHTDHDSALIWSCTREDIPLTRLLLSHGADPRSLHDCPLRIAALKGNAELTRLLTKKQTGVA